MKIDARTLLNALEGRIAASQVIDFLRRLPPSEILSLTHQANLSITGDGNIVGDNNVSIVVKGEGAAELASVLREALYCGRALFQLRPPVGDFVGRETEIKELMTTLRSNQAAAISGISGMGGIGKTELALYVADKLRAEYPDAQLFVSLRGTDATPRSAADALRTCVQALVGLEAKLPDEEEALTQLYRSQLTGKRALILLDNAADSAQVRPLLPPTGCALLVTSRTVLALSGSKRLTLDQLHATEAQELLCSIAPHLTADVADQIAYLCGYLPLALRAAGSLLAVTVDLEPADYVEQLREEHTRLEAIGEEEIERSMAATFQLSYARLSDEAARVLRALSVMHGSFDSRAAEVVAADQYHRHLSDLVKRSLVLYENVTKRYRLHDLVRLFAEKPLEAWEKRKISETHASYYLSGLIFAEKLYREGGASLKHAIWLLATERSNMRAGKEWATSEASNNDKAANICLGYANSSPYLLNIIQHPFERIEWLEDALVASRRLNDYEAGAITLGNLGVAYARIGDHSKAIAHLKERLKLAQNNDDPKGEMSAIANLGVIYLEANQIDDAIESFNETLAYSQEIADRDTEGGMMCNLGIAYLRKGEIEKALEHFNQSLVIARETKDRYAEGNSLHHLGEAYEHQEDLSLSLDCYLQSLEISREVHDAQGEGASLFSISRMLYKYGNKEKAVSFAKESLNIFDFLANPRAHIVHNTLMQWQSNETKEEDNG